MYPASTALLLHASIGSKHTSYLLDSQAENIGNVAVGASAIADILDQDALVIEERENLARMQEELREKLKAAEIEHSMERARLSRERNELDEKLRQFEQQKSECGTPSAESTDSEKRPKSGNWLARLGLKDES